MPTFGSEDELFAVLQGEMPDGVYSKDLAKNTDTTNNAWTSSEARTWAMLIRDAYVSLLAIYNNKFVTLADHSGIERWEKVLFATPVDGTLTWEERRDNLLTQLRYQGGINFAVINAAVSAILTPLALTYTISTLNGARPGSAWILDVGLLGLDTFLVGMDPIRGAIRTAPLDCDLDYEAAGLTLAQLQAIQATAYTYVVKITGTADDATLAKLDTVLTRLEGASRTHMIVNNVGGPYPDVFDGGLFTAPTDFGILDGGRFTIGSETGLIDGGTW